MPQLMLIINPGSTSTKLAVFDSKSCLKEKIIRPSAEELNQFEDVYQQLSFRKAQIVKWLATLSENEFQVIVGRGAPLRPLEGGSYKISESMIDDLKQAKYSNHASNLGPILAQIFGEQFGVPSMIADPITVDNLTDLARVSGLPEIERKGRSHALNIKEVARREASRLGKALDEVSFVAVHMGGGISVAALKQGLIIDVNDGLLGMGPFSPDRAGALPIGGLIKLCYSGDFSEPELIDKLSRKSGLIAYTGNSDLREVERLIDSGDKAALLAFEAMAYQISKEIGAAAVVLAGKLDGIILTGGMAHSRRLTAAIEKNVAFLGRVILCPGEFEMEALAAAGTRFLSGLEELKDY